LKSATASPPVAVALLRLPAFSVAAVSIERVPVFCWRWGSFSPFAVSALSLVELLVAGADLPRLEADERVLRLLRRSRRLRPGRG
jgi:hypothetical protein